MESRKNFIETIGLVKINKVLDIIEYFKIQYQTKNKNNKLKISGYHTTYLNKNKIWKWEIYLVSKKNLSLRNTIVIWASNFPNLKETEFKEIFEKEISIL